jgi:pimeloyl-ACP methyl ester carboxylesterase
LNLDVVAPVTRSVLGAIIAGRAESEDGMRKLAVLTVMLAVAAGTLVVADAPAFAASSASASSVRWGPCRTYTDDELQPTLHGHALADVKREISRRQCGFVSVPLDYGYPQGRQIKVAVTRFPALDTHHRLGALLINPGGPGEAGVLEPADVSLSRAGDLAKRFDLIGFDPRGVGDSVPRLDCDPESFRIQLTTDREVARQESAKLAAANVACAQRDSGLTASLTTSTIARDMDRIRTGLGEKKISYFGFSWGTGLGATYQTLFPQRVNRMVLDSSVDPVLQLDRWDDDIAAAVDVESQRFISWLASSGVGLGDTPAAVSATLDRIEAFFTAHPQDVPELGEPGDEFTVAFHSSNDSRAWLSDAEALVTLNKIASAPAPALFASGSVARPRIALAPEFFNVGVFAAVNCNGDTGVRDFDAWFTRWEQRRERFPRAGLVPFEVPECAGWPHPVRPERVADTGSSVLIVGHQFEVVTPIKWARAMSKAIGGATLTVDDDVHASLIDLPCASKAVSFLVSGKEPHGHCAGVPLPR